jgi:hypothetical protein
LDNLPPMPAAALASLLLRVSEAFTSTTWKPSSLQGFRRTRQDHVFLEQQEQFAGIYWRTNWQQTANRTLA